MKNGLMMLAATVVVSVWAMEAAAQIPSAQIVLENSSVRVSILSFPPGGGTGRHMGVEAEIGLVVEGQLTLDSPTGRQTLRAGTAYSLPGLTPHDVRNESGSPAKMWDIILKRCD
jgi:quercetin dioxygenase-like cupin family protein